MTSFMEHFTEDFARSDAGRNEASTREWLAGSEWAKGNLIQRIENWGKLAEAAGTPDLHLMRLDDGRMAWLELKSAENNPGGARSAVVVHWRRAQFDWIERAARSRTLALIRAPLATGLEHYLLPAPAVVELRGGDRGRTRPVDWHRAHSIVSPRCAADDVLNACMDYQPCR